MEPLRGPASMPSYSPPPAPSCSAASSEPVEIDQYACTSCHRCQQITGCPAIAFTPPIFHIDRDACAGCDLCVEYCRTNVIYSPRSRMTPEQRSRARYAAANQQ